MHDMEYHQNFSLSIYRFIRDVYYILTFILTVSIFHSKRIIIILLNIILYTQLNLNEIQVNYFQNSSQKKVCDYLLNQISIKTYIDSDSQ